MNLGRSVGKLPFQLNCILKMIQPKAKMPSPLMGYSGTNDIVKREGEKFSPSLAVPPFSVCNPTVFQSFTAHKPYPINRKMEDPDLGRRVKIEIPVTSILNGNLNLELPCHEEPEKVDPVKTDLTKKAKVHMTIIRRKKMRKHKLKKMRKRLKFVIAKIEREKRLQKEMALQSELKEILKEGDKFSSEKFLKDKLDLLNWVPPVTKARGRLAPQWVIKQELERIRLKEVYGKRIAECIQKNCRPA